MQSTWYTSQRFHQSALLIIALVLLGQGVSSIFFRENDFAVHRAMGKGFVEGQPYSHGLETYPVARMMLNGFIYLMPNYPVRAFCFFLAVLALWAIFRIWSGLAQGQIPASPAINRTAGIMVICLFFPYLLRDLDECGLQIFMLFFLSLAAYSLVRGKPHWTGFWIATGIHYKVAPLLFAPFLLWKRQWRASFFLAGFVVLWALVPALFIGLDATWEGHQRWFARVQIVNSSRDAYPSLQEFEPPKPQNLSLLAALARFVETYPTGHPLNLTHPWFRQFGNLEPLTAYYVVRGLLLVLGLGLAWYWRKKWTEQNLAEKLPGEWASVTMLVALLAPQCWKQHMVVILPAAFLVVRHQLLVDFRKRWRLGILCVSAVVLILTRQQVVGQELAVVFLSYKLDTFAAMVLLAMTLTLPRSSRSETRQILSFPVPSSTQTTTGAA